MPADMAERADEVAALLKSLAHPKRLLILCLLGQGERSVSELAELVELGQSALSQHLARLRHEGIVRTRRDGQTIYYDLASDEVRQIIALLYALYCEV